MARGSFELEMISPCHGWACEGAKRQVVYCGQCSGADAHRATSRDCSRPDAPHVKGSRERPVMSRSALANGSAEIAARVEVVWFQAGLDHRPSSGD